MDVPGYAPADDNRKVLDKIPAKTIERLARRFRQLEGGGDAQLKLAWDWHAGSAWVKSDLDERERIGRAG